MSRSSVCIVTPALVEANNGNWRTASRWAGMLRPHYRVELAERWDGQPADVMVALHALRSAASIERWSHHRPEGGLIVALTGTDLYRDIAVDPAARRSLDLADRLVVLHECAVQDVPAPHHAKTVVCFQSTSERAPLVKTTRHLRALMVGHLRDEKAPRTYFEAARRLAHRPDIRLDQAGAALDPALGAEAQALQQGLATFRWLGALPHGDTRRRIQGAHVLVVTSRMEGGAHVVMEAVRSGTPVLATRISGNVGMLGATYGGYFDTDDAAGLAALLERCGDEPATLQALREQCNLRAPLFAPAREQAWLLALIDDLPRPTR